jgi:hypothetical protein
MMKVSMTNKVQFEEMFPWEFSRILAEAPPIVISQIYFANPSLRFPVFAK